MTQLTSPLNPLSTGGEGTWPTAKPVPHWDEARRTPPELWEKLKPLAKQMRHQPTQAEEKLWQSLRNRQVCHFKFRRQHSIERFIVDFYCAEAQLMIEVDGEIHQYTVQEDAVRQAFLEGTGLAMLRFTNEQVMKNMEGVLASIQTFYQQHPLSACGEGAGGEVSPGEAP